MPCSQHPLFSPYRDAQDGTIPGGIYAVLSGLWPCLYRLVSYRQLITVSSDHFMVNVCYDLVVIPISEGATLFYPHHNSRAHTITSEAFFIPVTHTPLSGQGQSSRCISLELQE